eukprot:3961080-Heterocapsa_arctica.AAC.1
MSLCDPLCIFSGRAFSSTSRSILAKGGPVTYVQRTKSWTEMATVIHAVHHSHDQHVCHILENYAMVLSFIVAVVPLVPLYQIGSPGSTAIRSSSSD